MKPLMHATLALALAGCTAERPTPADLMGASPAPAVLSNLPPQVQSFIGQKEEQALALAKKLGVEPDRATLNYFHLARKAQYRAASRI